MSLPGEGTSLVSAPHPQIVPAPQQSLRQGLRAEFHPLVELALPVVAAEVAWMAMGMVDTLLLGRVGPEALGGMALGNSIFFFCMMLGMGLLYGLDYVVSVHQGAGRPVEGRRVAVQGVWISLAVTPVLMGVTWWGSHLLTGWGSEPEVIRYAQAFLDVVVWSLAPLLIYTALRRYLQSIGVVGPSLLIVVVANMINAAVGWVLIFGHLGFAPMEAVGAGWATTLSRIFMMVAFFGVLGWRAWRHHEGLDGISLKPDPVILRELLRLGGPAAVQTSLEVGMFAAVTALAGLLPAASLAAHQIALMICSFTFMVPLGISQAGAVRVGFRVGEGDARGAARAGWCALALGAGFMVCSAATLVLGRHNLVGWFTTDAETAQQATDLLVMAALFQVFDGLQVVATGVLRGAGDTATPARVNLVGNWVLGVPVAYFAAFTLEMGVTGLWLGLLVGLFSVGMTLLVRWHLTIRNFTAAPSGMVASQA